MEIDSTKSYNDLYMPCFAKIKPKKTSEIYVESNLDSSTKPQKEDDKAIGSSLCIFDYTGGFKQLTLNFKKTALHKWEFFISTKGKKNYLPLSVGNAASKIEDMGRKIFIEFDNSGEIKSIKDNKKNIDSEQFYITAYCSDDASKTMQPIRIYFNGKKIPSAVYRGAITQYSSPTTTKAILQNGYSSGYFQSFFIDNDGIIYGTGSNGQKIQVAKIALSVFKNNQELISDDNIYFKNINSENILKTNVSTKIFSGCIEMSNVDLSDEKIGITIIGTCLSELKK